MISINDQLPNEGDMTICHVNFWRYGKIHNTETLRAEYIGMNEVIDKPMWDIDTDDESYAEVTQWVIDE